MASTTPRTIDGFEVSEGIVVWDYDLRPRRVGKVAYTEAGDPWFQMFALTDGAQGSDMNGSRMWVHHPSNGRRAFRN